MNITGFNERQELVDWAGRVREQIVDRDPAAAHAIEEAIQQYRESRFVVTILGKEKRGKSTLTNAILGRCDDLLAPVDKLPASNVITRFSWADKPAATVYFRRGNGQATAYQEQIAYEQVREFVTEESNPKNRKGVEIVEVAGPFPEFDLDLTLVDTPGAGSADEYHNEVLHAFIPQSDAVIFLVTARMPLGEEELDLLGKVRAADVQKVLFAVNKVDATPPKDLEDAISHNRSLLAHVKIKVEHIHRISALQAFQGNLVESGLGLLVDELRQTLLKNKAGVLASRLVYRVAEAAEPVLRGLSAEIAAQGKSKEELQRQRDELSATKERLLTEQGVAKRQFLNRWTAAIDQFAGKLAEAREAVKVELIKILQETSLLSVANLARELPTGIATAIDNRLEPLTQPLESALKSACQHFHGAQPAIDLEAPDAVALGSTRNRAMWWGTAGGIGLGVTGGGVVAAGSAAAAGSVAYITAPSLVGGILTQLIGTSAGFVTTTAVPVAAPLWVAVAGPIGWTLGGIGALAIPFAWALSKTKQKTKLEEECLRQADKVFDLIRDERVPTLRLSGQSIAEEFELRLEREIYQVESALARVQSAGVDSSVRQETEAFAAILQMTLKERPRLSHDAQ